MVCKYLLANAHPWMFSHEVARWLVEMSPLKCLSVVEGWAELQTVPIHHFTFTEGAFRWGDDFYRTKMRTELVVALLYGGNRMTMTSSPRLKRRLFRKVFGHPDVRYRDDSLFCRLKRRELASVGIIQKESTWHESILTQW